MLDVRQLCDLGEFRLDLKRGLLLYRDEIIDLPPKAFATLLVLVGADGGVVDKQELMEKVWGDVYVDDNNLTQQISLLRKVLKDPAIIKTVKGRGYRLAVPVTDAPDVQRHPTIEQVVPSESPAADVAPETAPASHRPRDRPFQRQRRDHRFVGGGCGRVQQRR